ncbi:MAG: hypothetical protein ACI379_00095 [Nocardioides sp.]|uniref:hypothetical protein n=1 Tax=Nocardioides sp. TaxID=35761 RepID=UPI003EFDF859
MSRKQGESIAQRVANTRAGRAESPPAPAPAPELSPPGVQHCWYDGPYGRQAALLLEWRQRAGTWSGRIAVSVPEGDGWALVELWVEAGMLAQPGSAAHPGEAPPERAPGGAPQQRGRDSNPR